MLFLFWITPRFIHTLFYYCLLFLFMALRVLCFFQPGCMGCMEQAPINAEVGKKLGLAIEEIDATKNPSFIGEYQLKATPTFLIIVDGVVKERFEGVVHREQLEESIKKYL
jgi:thioredoxin 1